MIFIKTTPESNGAHESLITEDVFTVPEGFVVTRDDLEQKALLLLPWVKLTVTDGVIIAIEDDAEARKAWEALQRPNIEVEKSAKLMELSQLCNATITAGYDVTLSDGTNGHISMKDEDQINLMSAIGDVQSGASGAPYHLDGTLCRIYPAADIAIIAAAAKQHKLYHTTYCNHLNEWVRRCETVEAVQAITYGSALPEDLADNFAEVLGNGK